MWHHHNTDSAKALFDTRALNMGTAKKSHLLTNITAKDSAKLFRVIAIPPIQVVFLNNKNASQTLKKAAAKSNNNHKNTLQNPD